jgi:hypothetical protein
MTNNELAGVALGAGVTAAALQKVYAVQKWDVPMPVWLGVTAALTGGGWLAYKKFCPVATAVTKA